LNGGAIAIMNVNALNIAEVLASNDHIMSYPFIITIINGEMMLGDICLTEFWQANSYLGFKFRTKFAPGDFVGDLIFFI
jgi:hypothetical protein